MPVLSTQGDRRADLLVTRPNGKSCVALEVQHSSLTCEELAARISAYVAADMGVAWIPIISLQKLKPVRIAATNILKIEKFKIPPWWRWLISFYESLWLYEPSCEKLWRIKTEPHHLWREERNWFLDGSEQSSGGFWYKSSQGVDAFLQGPFPLEQMRINPFRGERQRVDKLWIPAGKRAELTFDGEISWPLRQVPVEAETPSGATVHCGWRDEIEIAGSWITAKLEPK